MENLTSAQRAYLRSLANRIETIFQIGKDGIGETFVRQVDEALEKREGATVVVDESALLELVGNSKALNIILLTVAISQRDAQGNPLLGISLDEFKEAIRVCVKPKFVDMNLAAVDAVCKELGLQ